MKKIYFAGSIRGGRADAELYRRIIACLQEKADVLTEHVGNLSLNPLEQQGDRAIRDQDAAWLREADLVVAECTTPSLGVGWELGYAQSLKKPCHILWNRARTSLSAMLTGDPWYRLHPYEKEEDLRPILQEILREPAGDAADFVKSVCELDPAPIVLCDLNHTIRYMNPAAVKRYAKYGGAALMGSDLLACHNERSVLMIRKAIEWFQESPDHNRLYISHNPKENRDTYMVALRDGNGTLIGYWEKHEYRTPDGAVPFSSLFEKKES